jgi:short-subunit dehydrogenase
MNVVREILPYFKKTQRDDYQCNVTSMGDLITFLFYSAYQGTEWAVDGRSEALSFELQALG